MNSYDIVSLIVLAGLASLAIFCFAFRKKDLSWILRPDDYINTQMITMASLNMASKLKRKKRV
jgi:hypothetical protein